MTKQYIVKTLEGINVVTNWIDNGVKDTIILRFSNNSELFSIITLLPTFTPSAIQTPEPILTFAPNSTVFEIMALA